jgi:hypothetical protein
MPSAGHLRVASTPIFPPKAGRNRGVVEIVNGTGHDLNVARGIYVRARDPGDFRLVLDVTSLSTTTTHFENISWPSPHTALITFRA